MKRKILSVMIAVIICFSSVLPVFASPKYISTNKTEVFVSEEPGLVMYYAVWNADYTKSILRPMVVYIPAGTLLTVTDEYEFDGELYGETTYHDNTGYIKLSGLTPRVSEAEPNEEYKTNNPRSIAVINKEGIYLSKGPSNVYETASELIEYGTVLTYEYTNAEYESMSSWAYVTHEDVSGWVYIYQNRQSETPDVAYVLDENNFYTGKISLLSEGAYLTETPDIQSQKLIENIPAGTEFSFKYYCNHNGFLNVFVEYNKVKGWLSTGSDDYKAAIGAKSGIYVFAQDGLPIYSKPFDESSKTDILIPKNTSLPVDNLCFDVVKTDDSEQGICWMHTEYDGTEGWVFVDNSEDYSLMYGVNDYKVTAENGIVLYSEPDKKSQQLSFIPENAVVTVDYDAFRGEDIWVHVQYGDVFGWIIENDGKVEYVNGSEKQPDSPLGAQPISASENEKDKSQKAPELVENNLIMIIIACAACVLVVAAIVLIIIVRKKKKKEENN